ncbi:MAG: hypothetical protein BHV69_10555 [Bacteroidales bacterium 52_46]|nr:MAG: hypothetical protein BHV69_10555 [Bacteroidales bacterium 52_46]
MLFFQMQIYDILAKIFAYCKKFVRFFCIKILLKHADASKCCLLKLSGAGASRPRGNFLELKTIARGRDALAPLNSA